MVQPAYLIPLTPENLALLGELVVILGQIEEDMVQGVSGLILADRPTTEKVMGASKMGNKAEIWRALIKLKHKDNSALHQWVDYAFQQLSDLSQDRNDFVHANWQHIVRVSHMTENRGLEHLTEVHMRLSGDREPSPNPRGIARRIQNFSKTRTGEELQQVRDKPASLSCVIAHITHCIATGKGPDARSPWRDKLPPLPEPRPAKGEARKGKAHGGPPESSEA